MAEDEEPERTRLEDIKYYTSLFLGTLAICSLFAFLFLVPFILDPAISTMMHDFVEKPVHCKVRNLLLVSCYLGRSTVFNSFLGTSSLFRSSSFSRVAQQLQLEIGHFTLKSIFKYYETYNRGEQ